MFERLKKLAWLPWDLAGVVIQMGRLIAQPTRLPPVFALDRHLVRQGDDAHFVPVLTHIRRSPLAVDAFRRQPRLGAVDLDALSRLPAGTLGHEYARFVRENRLDPDDIPRKRVLPGRDIDYLVAHLYETHDLWHVATGYGTDVAGELGLQAFYAAHYPATMSLLVIACGLINAALFDIRDWDRRMAAVSEGYAAGRAARPMVGFEWNRRWEQPLEELRAELGIRSVPAEARRTA
jgi:ubiquinone biosynthesis protein Coq4